MSFKQSITINDAININNIQEFTLYALVYDLAMSPEELRVVGVYGTKQGLKAAATLEEFKQS